MSYMRSPYYVYSDGENLHIYGEGGVTALPEETAEELAVLLVSRLTEKELDAAILRASEKHGGNFGGEGLMRGLGLPTAYDRVQKLLEEKSA